MKKFKVYQHPILGYEAVKEGFLWPALFFNLIWMVMKKLWGIASIWFAVLIILVSVHIVVSQTMKIEFEPYIHSIFVLGYFVLCLIPALKGNQWRETNLVNRGFELLSSIQANVSDAAIAEQAKKDQKKTSAEPVIEKQSDTDTNGKPLAEEEIPIDFQSENNDNNESDEIFEEEEQANYFMPFISHYEFEIEQDDELEEIDNAFDQKVDDIDQVQTIDQEDEESNQESTNNPVINNDEIEIHEMPGLKHQTIGGQKQGLKTMEVWLQTMAPGSATPVHCHACEEVIHILSGYGKCTIGHEFFEFGPNSTLVIEPDVVHQLFNTSSDELKLIAALGTAPVRVKTAAGVPLSVPWEAPIDTNNKWND